PRARSDLRPPDPALTSRPAPSSRQGSAGQGAGSPDRDGALPTRVVAGDRLAGRGPVEAPLHPVRQHARLHHLDEHRGDVAEVEPVAPPRPLPFPRVTEPGPADPEHLVRRPVRALGVGDLLPEADDLALALVDQDALVRVDPAVQAAHLLAEGDVADLVAADGHEVLLGADVPAVGG